MCSKAIDTNYIDIDDLKERKLINKILPYKEKNPNKINYKSVSFYKNLIFRKAYETYIKTNSKQLENYIEENLWVKEYAVFMYLYKKNEEKSWNEWSIQDINIDLSKGFPLGGEDECRFTCFLQYIAYEQWNKLFSYLKSLNIKVIADCPFYVGKDSTECFFNKKFFLLRKDFELEKTGGFPPDAFSDVGQVWNTAMFNFKTLKRKKYSLIVDRIGFLSQNCDYLRLDHFRGFVSYYVIPYGDLNAKRGKWRKGPAYKLFKKLYEKYPNAKLIAEDLGGEEVKGVGILKKQIKAPGMYVVQFNLFNPNSKSTKDQIVYPGTHDNSPLKGWLKSLDEKDIKKLQKKFHNPKDLYGALFKYISEQESYLTIFQFQDLYAFDDSTRINVPGTLDDKNWSWKIADPSIFKKPKYLPKVK